jgi:hypothetical protein
LVPSHREEVVRDWWGRGYISGQVRDHEDTVFIGRHLSQQYPPVLNESVALRTSTQEKEKPLLNPSRIGNHQQSGLFRY